MERKAALSRETTETKITVTVSLDGSGSYEVNTGVGFFDHMLELFARHGLLDLDVRCDGDLHVDAHHSVEDTGIVLGKAILSALGDKKGIRRFGTAFVPMDEALCQVSLDVSGRPFLSYKAPPMQPRLGAFDTELLEEFLRALAVNAGLTLHVLVHYGTSAHHMVEGVFKALGRACREAFGTDPGTAGRVPSTKGTL
ncbi:MAG: imidazoleglycerol-phosphate dehydratase HisB [Christensenellales bacterium]|jgi:imidazoleglycerol-phosphate dehydratase